MQFTTQQLIGGPRYTGKVRIGNWSEDEARFDVAAQDYEERKSKGDLLYMKKQRQKVLEGQAVPLSHASDGLVRFGDSVQLVLGVDERKRVLAANTFISIKPGHARLTASDITAAQARNVFVITRPAPAAGAFSAATEDDVLRYGDRFYLAANPSLTADPTTGIVGLQTLVQSQRTSNVTGAGSKGRQEATLCVRRGADAEWVAADASGDRIATDGTPVRAGEPLCIVHAMSHEALAAFPGDVFPTDFGLELDVHVNTYRKAGRHASMDVATDLPRIPALPPNLWTFALAPSADAAVDRRGFRALTPEALIDRARGAISARSGPHGLRSLTLALSAVDQRGTGVAPRDVVQWALFDHGVLQSDDEFTLMLAPFSHAAAPSTPLVDLNALLAALRGPPLTAARAAVVRDAFAHLSAKASAAAPGAGAPTRADLLRLTHIGKADPRVAVGRVTPAEAAAEFARQWPGLPRATDAVDAGAFAAYYDDVSAMVPDDGDFVVLVANTWHLPGQGSWRGKMGKRVQATLHKGSVLTLVIAGGEDIADSDFEGLVAALKAQGVTGVARIKVLGLVEPE